MKTSTAPRAIALVGAVFFLVGGAWAFFAPQSFFDVVATYQPYNEHLFHDLGAFQIGLGAALLLSLVYADALFVALGGVAIGSVLHGIAHFMDKDQGGRSSDPWALSLFGVILAVGAYLQLKRSQPE